MPIHTHDQDDHYFHGDVPYIEPDYYANNANKNMPILSTVARGPQGDGVLAEVIASSEDTFIYRLVNDVTNETFFQSPNLSAGKLTVSQTDVNPEEGIFNHAVFTVTRGGVTKSYDVTIPPGSTGSRVYTIEGMVPKRSDNLYRWAEGTLIFDDHKNWKSKPKPRVYDIVMFSSHDASRAYLAAGVVRAVENGQVVVTVQTYVELLTPYIGENGNWWVGEFDTGVKAQGPKGDKGTFGPPVAKTVPFTEKASARDLSSDPTHLELELSIPKGEPGQPVTVVPGIWTPETLPAWEKAVFNSCYTVDVPGKERHQMWARGSVKNAANPYGYNIVPNWSGKGFTMKDEVIVETLEDDQPATVFIDRTEMPEDDATDIQFNFGLPKGRHAAMTVDPVVDVLPYDAQGQVALTKSPPNDYKMKLKLPQGEPGKSVIIEKGIHEISELPPFEVTEINRCYIVDDKDGRYDLYIRGTYAVPIAEGGPWTIVENWQGVEGQPGKDGQDGIDAHTVNIECLNDSLEAIYHGSISLRAVSIATEEQVPVFWDIKMWNKNGTRRTGTESPTSGGITLTVLSDEIFVDVTVYKNTEGVKGPVVGRAFFPLAQKNSAEFMIYPMGTFKYIPGRRVTFVLNPIDLRNLPIDFRGLFRVYSYTVHGRIVETKYPVESSSINHPMSIDDVFYWVEVVEYPNSDKDIETEHTLATGYFPVAQDPYDYILEASDTLTGKWLNTNEKGKITLSTNKGSSVVPSVWSVKQISGKTVIDTTRTNPTTESWYEFAFDKTRRIDYVVASAYIDGFMVAKDIFPVYNDEFSMFSIAVSKLPQNNVNSTLEFVVYREGNPIIAENIHVHVFSDSSNETPEFTLVKDEVNNKYTVTFDTDANRALAALTSACHIVVKHALSNRLLTEEYVPILNKVRNSNIGVATITSPGLVRPGTGLAVTEDGTLNVTSTSSGLPVIKLDQPIPLFTPMVAFTVQKDGKPIHIGTDYTIKITTDDDTYTPRTFTKDPAVTEYDHFIVETATPVGSWASTSYVYFELTEVATGKVSVVTEPCPHGSSNMYIPGASLTRAGVVSLYYGIRNDEMRINTKPRITINDNVNGIYRRKDFNERTPIRIQIHNDSYKALSDLDLRLENANGDSISLASTWVDDTFIVDNLDDLYTYETYNAEKITMRIGLIDAVDDGLIETYHEILLEKRNNPSEILSLRQQDFSGGPDSGTYTLLEDPRVNLQTIARVVTAQDGGYGQAETITVFCSDSDKYTKPDGTVHIQAEYFNRSTLETTILFDAPLLRRGLDGVEIAQWTRTDLDQLFAVPRKITFTYGKAVVEDVVATNNGSFTMSPYINDCYALNKTTAYYIKNAKELSFEAERKVNGTVEGWFTMSCRREGYSGPSKADKNHIYFTLETAQEGKFTSREKYVLSEVNGVYTFQFLRAETFSHATNNGNVTYFSYSAPYYRLETCWFKL